MYINRIVLRDVRGFNLDISLRNDWTQEPLKSVLFTGINGSGKTTVLNVVAILWEYFSRRMQGKGRDFILARSKKGVLADAGFAAIEIRDLLDLPLWLFAGSDGREEHKLRTLQEDAYYIGEIYHFPMEKQLSVRGKLLYDFQVDSIQDINLRRRQLELGVTAIKTLPNLVFLESEGRAISSNQRDEEKAEPLYRWLVNVGKSSRANREIERMLGNTKLRDPNLFHSVIQHINEFFVGKRLVDFDNNLRLQVQVGTKTHTIDELSSGEKQCLIMMFMVSRWLMDGGIVLIDEPDLHLHVSLQRHFIHELEKLVLSKNGQLIVASHSPELWEEYSERQRIDLTAEVKHG